MQKSFLRNLNLKNFDVRESEFVMKVSFQTVFTKKIYNNCLSCSLQTITVRINIFKYFAIDVTIPIYN